MVCLPGKVLLTGEGHWGEKRQLRPNCSFQGQYLGVRVIFVFPVIIQLRVLDDGEPARIQCRSPHQGDGCRGLMFLHAQPWDVKGTE